mgnify:CR=1 FL=1
MAVEAKLLQDVVSANSLSRGLSTTLAKLTRILSTRLQTNASIKSLHPPKQSPDSPRNCVVDPIPTSQEPVKISDIHLMWNSKEDKVSVTLKIAAIEALIKGQIITTISLQRDSRMPWIRSRNLRDLSDGQANLDLEMHLILHKKVVTMMTVRQAEELRIRVKLRKSLKGCFFWIWAKT